MFKLDWSIGTSILSQVFFLLWVLLKICYASDSAIPITFFLKVVKTEPVGIVKMVFRYIVYNGKENSSNKQKNFG